MMIDPKAFGMRLQSVREAHGMTQEELSRKSGLSPHYIGNIEQGVRMPSGRSFMKLCHAVGATPNDLLQDFISPEMLEGLSVDVSNATTLRETLAVFDGILSDFFMDDEQERCLFGVPLSQIPVSDQISEEDTLTSLLADHPSFASFKQ